MARWIPLRVSSHARATEKAESQKCLPTSGWWKNFFCPQIGRALITMYETFSKPRGFLCAATEPCPLGLVASLLLQSASDSREGRTKQTYSSSKNNSAQPQ